MQRRQFLRLGATVAAGVPLLAAGSPARRARPPGPGSRIGLVAPASSPTPAQVATAEANVRALGWVPVRTGAPLLRSGEFAGTDAQRAADLLTMYARADVDAIWAIRGGYGTNRLLDRLDFRLVRRHPKPLIGYSDLTTLLNVIHARTGSPCFHGPVAAAPLGDYARSQLAPLYGTAPHTIPLAAFPEVDADLKHLYTYQTLRAGSATGKLVGGNLTLLSSLCGTPHLPRAKGAIIFLEDVGEAPYRIDRMLTQLRDAGFFRGARGIALGIFKGCQQRNPTYAEDYSLHAVLRERLAFFDGPIGYGFPVGHVDRQCTLPIGATARMDADTGELVLLENGY